MIDVQGLSVSYGNIPVLNDVSLHIPAGSFTLLTGVSGCGKSTLARAITGIIPHARPARVQGQVRVAGQDVASLSLPELAATIPLIFQNPAAQLFHLKVQEEVAFGPRNLGLSPSEIATRVDWALEAVGISHLRQRVPAQLSGGQQQLVAIAAALALQPRALVLDEPTASLDETSARQVLATLQHLRDELDMTIFLIEHRLTRALPYVDNVFVMEQGRIILDTSVASPDDLSSLHQLGLLPDSPPPKSWPDLIQPAPPRTPSDTPLLSLEKVTAGYGKHLVLQDVNLHIHPGDFLALVGENGAGKTTLARVAAGLLKPKQGQVRWQGKGRPRPGTDVSLLFQNPLDQLFTERVEDEVAFGPRNLGKENPSWLDELLHMADLRHLRQRHPLSLSAGQQQRTALAACAALNPALLILDEPTLGQDWGHLQQLMDFLTRLNEAGVTILLISHDYELIHRYARRAILLHQGRIIMEGEVK